MSFPPPHPGPYPPQYIHPSQYQQRGHVAPPQLLYNNVAPSHSPTSPYNGYGKPGMYPPAMMSQYPAYPQTYNGQPQQPAPSPPQPSLSPKLQPQPQHPPPQLQPQTPPQPQQRASPQKHHAPAPAPPPPPPPPPQEEPEHQFVNPAQLFVEPPLPTAPRSRYTQFSSQYDEPAVSVPGTTSAQPHSSLPGHITPAPTVSPRPNSQNNQSQAAPTGQQSQPQPMIKTESAQPDYSFKVEIEQTHPSLKTTSMQSQPTASPAEVVPQVMVPAPSKEALGKIQKVPSKKQQQQKAQPGQQTSEKPTKPAKPSVDYQVLLLSLADEYLNAAHRHGTRTALVTREADVEEYYKLIATGLGCLEAVLKNWRLQPRKEALVRLRYARTLFEETDNDFEAETALSKGIDLCERNRMLDLKYSMQHLLARLLHKTNPKASLKAVDGMIQAVEAYRHAAWEYAFRFLRVTLSLSSPSHQDSVQALHHLHKIAAMANRNGEKAVSAMAAVIEALTHLQQGSSSDSVEQAQRAVAVARSHQLNDELRHIPQLTALIQLVDICCSLLEYDLNQSAQKLKILQTVIDDSLNDTNWPPDGDGSFSIPLNGKSAGPSSMDTGDILQVQNGTLLLSFSWFPKRDLYVLCYFLSSITLSAKNSYDGRKAEKYIDEGLRTIQGNFKVPHEISESMANANRRVEWRQTIYCSLLLQQVFLACARTDWDLARQTLNDLHQVAQELGPSLPDSIECLMEYAAGTIAQGTGDLKAALTIFQSPLFSLSSSVSKTTRNDPRRDTAILAAVNTMLIIRDPTHPSHSHLPAVLSTLESFCKYNPNKYILSAYYLVCATMRTDSTLQTKQFLQHALQSATAITNSQITCITLALMSWKYFRGVVGEQAEKSARASRAMAMRAGDRLWTSVTDEMLAETYERQGKADEAQGTREEGRRFLLGLPPGLSRSA